MAHRLDLTGACLIDSCQSFDAKLFMPTCLSDEFAVFDDRKSFLLSSGCFLTKNQHEFPVESHLERLYKSVSVKTVILPRFLVDMGCSLMQNNLDCPSLNCGGGDPYFLMNLVLNML